MGSSKKTKDSKQPYSGRGSNSNLRSSPQQQVLPKYGGTSSALNQSASDSVQSASDSGQAPPDAQAPAQAPPQAPPQVPNTRGPVPPRPPGSRTRRRFLSQSVRQLGGGKVKTDGTYMLEKNDVVIPANRVKEINKVLKEAGLEPLPKETL